MKTLKILLFITLFYPVSTFAQASSTTSTTTRFVVPLNTPQEKVVDMLVTAGYVKNKNILNGVSIAPGGYKLSSTMNEQEVLKILQAKPYMVWVVVPPGLRKEEIANILEKNLGWTKNQKKNFLGYTNQTYNYLEGTYFPDTYLIPTGEDPKTTYNRFIAKFNENFSPLQKEFARQNFPWKKALTLASLVEREAASKEDMPLIAGILLNRINAKMHLGVDATVQYIRGDKNANIKGATTTAYWAPINIADKKINSKYNTYKYIGLPPHPIASPSLEAIKAALNPATTSCLYYLHKEKNTYCANTYEEHLQNIEKYLK